jgi:hypothetical protein
MSPAARVRVIPAAVGLGQFDLPETLLGHPAFVDQARDIGNVDLAP